MIIDCPHPQPSRFLQSLSSFVSVENVVAEHKADEKYPIVSAASIIAKVTRDGIIESYKEEYGEIGSGYPSDPKTINFLKRYVEEFGELPKIARKSWKTSKRILEENKKQKNLLDYVKKVEK